MCCHHLNKVSERTRPEAEDKRETLSSTRPERRLFPFYRNVRAISTARLNASPRLHLRPIDVVVCDGPWRDLISEPASCLDAFSTYPAQTRLPGCAPGGTTGAPEVCPARRSVQHGPLVLVPVLLKSQRPQQIETELSHDVLNPARVPL